MAVNCLINKDLTKATACGFSLNQISTIFLANYDEMTGSTVTETSGNKEVSSITMAQDAKWYQVDPAVNSASWSDTLGVGGNGNKYRIHTVGFSYSSAYDAGLVGSVEALSLGKFVAVVKTDSGYYMLGRQLGLEAQADGVNNSGSGDATAESGLIVSLTGNATEVALPLSSTAIETVVGQ